MLILVDFAFPVTFATGFFVLASFLGICSGISLEGSIRDVSGSVGMPREDSNRLAVFVWSVCTVVGVVFVFAGGVVFLTVFRRSIGLFHPVHLAIGECQAMIF